MTGIIDYLRVHPMLQIAIGWTIGGGICLILSVAVTVWFERWLEERP